MTFRSRMKAAAVGTVMAVMVTGGFSTAYSSPIDEVRQGHGASQVSVQYERLTTAKDGAKENTSICQCPPESVESINQMIKDAVNIMRTTLALNAGGTPNDEIHARVYYSVSHGTVTIGNLDVFAPNAPGASIDPRRIHLDQSNIRIDPALDCDGNVTINIRARGNGARFRQ